MRGLCQTVLAVALAWGPAARAAPASASSERGRRLLDDAVLASVNVRPLDASQDLSPRFRAAVEENPRYVPALLDYAVALDRAGKLEEAQSAYRAAAAADGFPELRFEAAARAAAIAVDRADVAGARTAVGLARAALPEDASPLVLESRVA